MHNINNCNSKVKSLLVWDRRPLYCLWEESKTSMDGRRVKRPGLGRDASLLMVFALLVVFMVNVLNGGQLGAGDPLGSAA